MTRTPDSPETASRLLFAKKRGSDLDESIESCADWLLRGARAPAVAILAIVLFVAAMIALLLENPNAQKVDTETSAIGENAWNGEATAWIKQPPTRDDLISAQQQADELRSQLGQATEQIKASQARTSQLEAELQAHLRAAQVALLDRGDSLLSSGDIASARLF